MLYSSLLHVVSIFPPRKFTSPISDPVAAGEQLKATVGVVDHGLFTSMTTACDMA